MAEITITIPDPVVSEYLADFIRRPKTVLEQLLENMAQLHQLVLLFKPST